MSGLTRHRPLSPTAGMIKLIPLAMSIPNESGIYQLSQYQNPLTVTVDEWHTYHPRLILAGTPDSYREVTAYGKGLDCWYLAMEAK